MVELETRACFNDDLESRNFYVLGVIAIKGVGPEILWPEILALAVLGVALLRLAASGGFKKTPA